MKTVKLIAPLLFLLGMMTSVAVSAQYYKNQGYWKKSRVQIHAGIGASNFLGELGGRDRQGSDFIWDLERKQFKPALSLGVRYFLRPKLALRVQGSYTTLAGDDALTAERFRSNRNLHFRSSLIEGAVLFEANIYNVRPGHRYNLAGAKGRKPRAANIYAFVGLAGIKFNPQAKVGDEWFDLQPLSTEGQGLQDGPDAYSLFSLAVPLGIGYRFKTKGGLYMGVEIGHRLTFTDYIDDVSTDYYDNDQILADRGVVAAFLADPSNGFYIDPTTGEEVPERMSFTGEQRGDPTDNDAYLFAQATVTYLFSNKPYRKRRPTKKKGRRVVF